MVRDIGQQPDRKWLNSDTPSSACTEKRLTLLPRKHHSVIAAPIQTGTFSLRRTIIKCNLPQGPGDKAGDGVDPVRRSCRANRASRLHFAECGKGK